jgi:ADP-ribose pyrophosphatase
MDETISSKLIYDGRVVKLRVDTVRIPDGRETTREIVEHADCIGVVVVDGANVLLVRQYRKPPEKELLEIPAGGIDPGETPEEAVKREMQEETGYLPRKLVKLGGYYLAPGYSTEYLHLYLATDLVVSQRIAEDTAEITLVKIPVGEISDLLASGRISDGKSIAGLYMFLAHRERNTGLR